MLMSAFFGCRFCSIFDTRVKLDSLDGMDSDLKIYKIVKHKDGSPKTSVGNEQILTDDVSRTEYPDLQRTRKREANNSISTPRKRLNNANRSARSIRSKDKDSDDEFKTIRMDEDSDEDYSICDDNDVIDDDCLVGDDTTKSFLYKYIIIFVIADSNKKKPNRVFMKITQPNTKGQDNNSRV